jgi:membrane-bound serine protease (ClpP class)
MFWEEAWFIVLVCICIAVFIAFLVYKLLGTKGLKPSTGGDDLLGAIATVRKTLNPEGTVFYRGELWDAVSEEGRIEAGETVFVCKIEGLKLFVIKAKKETKK